MPKVQDVAHHLAVIMQEVALLKMAPDAPPGLADQIEQLVMGAHQGANPGADQMAGSAGGPQMPPGEGPGEMSRGPIPPPDLAAMASAAQGPPQ